MRHPTCCGINVFRTEHGPAGETCDAECRPSTPLLVDTARRLAGDCIKSYLHCLHPFSLLLYRPSAPYSPTFLFLQPSSGMYTRGGVLLVCFQKTRCSVAHVLRRWQSHRAASIFTRPVHAPSHRSHAFVCQHPVEHLGVHLPRDCLENEVY